MRLLRTLYFFILTIVLTLGVLGIFYIGGRWFTIAGTLLITWAISSIIQDIRDAN